MNDTLKFIEFYFWKFLKVIWQKQILLLCKMQVTLTVDEYTYFKILRVEVHWAEYSILNMSDNVPLPLINIY